MKYDDRGPLSFSRGVLSVLITLNWVFGTAILGLLVWSVISTQWLSRALGFGDNRQLLGGMQLIALIGIAAVPVSHLILTRLRSIVDTVRDGDPFVSSNAKRLQTVAWALLALELSRFVVVALARLVSTPGHELDIKLNFSVTPWLAVLLLFVLARVFEHGAVMRDELEATV